MPLPPMADTRRTNTGTLMPTRSSARAAATKNFILESRAGGPTLLSRRRLMAEHPIEQVGSKLREMMPWIKANKLVDQTRN